MQTSPFIIRGEKLTSVSIAVCVRDGKNWIDGCMESLVNQTHDDFEVILVDDGSTDGGEELVKKWESHEKVTTINQGKKGLSAGRMAALEIATGEWFAITDIDVRPESDWLERLIEESNSRKGEEIMAVTGRTIFQQADDTISKIRSIEIQSKYRSRPRLTNLANGPCSMFKRSRLLEIGGFDPDWYHAEDMEVSLKLLELGGVIIYAPHAVVNHVPETGLKRFLHKRRRDARAHVRIHRRYKQKKYDFIGSSWTVLWFTPMLVLLVLGLFEYSQNLRLFDDYLSIDAIYNSLTKEVLLLLIGPLFWGFVYFNSDIPKSGISSKFVLLAWSIYLWQGILLGYIDALLKRNGH